MTRPDIVSRTVGDETILLHTPSGNYFALNLVASRIWDLANAGMSSEAACQSIAFEFEVDALTVEQDVAILAGELSAFGIALFRTNDHLPSLNFV